MFGALLVMIAEFFHEISVSIGKHEIEQKKESPYTFASLSLLASFVFFLILVIFVRQELLFDPASIPTFGLRLILEIFLIHFGLKGVVLASRSTFGFLSSLTIPLLLIVDYFVGYALSFQNIIGIVVILFALAFLTLNHGIGKRGVKYVLLTSVLAVGTISLFKYNITNFNSVEAEQMIFTGILAIYFMVTAKFIAGENPIKFLKKKIILSQSVSSGVGTVLESFAYLYAPPSIIISIKRSGRILWTIIFGNVYFKEKHVAIKFVGLGLFGIALLLLTI
ncbi:MAG: hypothetical protein L3J07_01675 [Candidatus Magasanikbacteria bacterium]|nr:hypothetical protein [Candidatus Magasanikbacteria bacterium]